LKAIVQNGKGAVPVDERWMYECALRAQRGMIANLRLARWLEVGISRPRRDKRGDVYHREGLK
jgi:hypothetical protein